MKVSVERKIVSWNFYKIFDEIYFPKYCFLDSNAGCGGGIQGSLNSRYCGGYLNDLKDAKGNVPICGKYNLKFISWPEVVANYESHFNQKILWHSLFQPYLSI